MTNKIIVAAVLAASFKGAAWAGSNEALVARENKAWALINEPAQRQDDAAAASLLERFLRAFPKGSHAGDAAFARAEILFRQGAFDRAAEIYEELASSRDDAYRFDSWLRLGEISYNRGDFEKARKNWSKLADKGFGRSVLSAEALYGLALCDMRAQNYLDAIHTMDRLIRKYPAYGQLPKVRELLGILRYNEKNYREAVAALEGVSTPVAAFYRGLSHFHQKQYQEAAQAFNTLSEMPSSAYAESGAFLKAECFRMVQNDALSSRAYGDFIARFPDSKLQPQALVYEARALNNLGRTDEAVKIAQSLRGKPVSRDVQVEAIFLEAEIAAKKGDAKRAIELPREALKIVGRDQPERFIGLHTLLTYYLLKMGKQEEAAESMMELARQMPQHPLGAVAYILSGRQAYAKKDLQKSVSDYESALLKYDYTPLSDVAMAMMLSAYFEAGKFQELVTHANRVMNVVNAEYEAQDIRWRGYSQMLIAESYYRIANYPEASRFYEQAMKEPLLTNQARLSLAWSRYHESRYGDALRLAKQVLSQRESGEEAKSSALLLMAGSYFNQKNYAAAVDTFRTFRQNYPNDSHVPETWLNEGWAQQQAGNYGDALQTWRRLVRFFPHHVLAEEADLQIGRLYFQARKYEMAAGVFIRFMTQWPKSRLIPDAQWQLAQTYYNSRQDAAAIRAYEAFLARFPGDKREADAQNQLMQTRYRQAIGSGDTKLLSAFVQLYPKSTLAPEAQYRFAQKNFERKQWSEALSGFRKLLLDYPGTSQAPLSLLAVGNVEERLKQPSLAVTEYKSLVDLFPNDPAAVDAAMRMGALNFSLGKFKEAVDGFRFALEHEAPKEVKAAAAYNMAVAYKKARSFPDAAEAFDHFLRDFPNDSRQVDALLEMAAIYRQIDRFDGAAEAYGRLLARADVKSPAKMEIYNQLGDMYRSQGDKQKAIGAYTQLISLAPAKQEARLLGLAQLAALYEEAEQWPQALEIYRYIQASGGKAQWVGSAAKRSRQIQAYIKNKQSAADAVADKVAVDPRSTDLKDAVRK